MLILLALALIVLTMTLILGLYLLYQESHELDYIASEGRCAEMRVQAMDNQARARISDIANSAPR